MKTDQVFEYVVGGMQHKLKNGRMNFLNKIETKWALTFWGLVISLAYIVYVEVIQRDTPMVSFLITSNSNVLDINDSVPNLEVTFANKSLLDIKEKLKLLTIKIENTGNVNITENMYYSGTNFGFTLKNGKLIQIPKIIDSNFPNIPKQVEFIDSLNFVQLPKIPMDKGEYYIIKTLYFAQGAEADLETKGKISGIKDFKISKYSDNPPPRYSIFTDAFRYLIFTIILLVFIISIRSTIDYFKHFGRRRLLHKFTTLHTGIYFPEVIKSLFLEFGKIEFIKLEGVLTDTAQFVILLESDRAKMQALLIQREFDPFLYKQYDYEYCKGVTPYPLKKLIDGSSAIFNHPRLHTSTEPMNQLKPEFVESIALFFEFLKHN